MTKRRLWNEECGLLLGGVMGLGGVALFACSSDTSSSATAADGGAEAASGSSTSSGSSGSSGGTASCASDEATADNTAAVVAAANALLATLTTAQQAAVQLEATAANARQWSNLPVTMVKRNGVPIGEMSAEAQAAAVALAAVAAGGTGSALLSELREADAYLVTNGGASANEYGRGLYYVSFHGTPSTTAPWMLQIAGHHLAYNFSYGAKCTSATPLFDGVEPTSWTDTKAHAPLEAQRAAMVALLASVSGAEAAKLAGTFSDLLTGPPPGSGDTKYPASLAYPTGTTGRGVLVGTLGADQKALVKTAIEAWVKNVADPVSSSLLAAYESDDALAQTYVGFSGSADLSTQSSYVRIDGPRAWIEVTVQGGIVYRGKIHFHTIWRDKVADYGAEYASP